LWYLNAVLISATYTSSN